jgi:carbon monoxide dehydrogenase subunit G
MGFSFEQAFVVKAPADKVFAYLIDPYRVAPALPGAALGEKGEDGSYAGTITIKVGPVTARYRGKMRFDNIDAAAHAVTIVASGQDTSGRGGADMRMQSHLIENAPGQTQVSVTSEVNVTGVLAQFGRGMIQDVSNQIFQRFSEAVRAELEKDEAAAQSRAAATTAPPVEQPNATPAPVTSSRAPAGAPSSSAPGFSAPVSSPAPTPASAPAPRSAPAPVSAPIDIASVGSKALGRAALRSLGRPGVWVVLFLVILALYWSIYR